jgi:hypothetical protein
MKTTIDIPDELYKKAKIRAIEQGLTLKQVVLTALKRELGVSPFLQEPTALYWANRKLLPEFEAAQKAGAYRPNLGDRDITELISNDRDGH